MFIPESASAGNVNQPQPVLSKLGTFVVAEAQPTGLLRNLRDLVLRMGDLPFSCEIGGRIINMRRSLRTVRREFFGCRQEAPDLPAFEDGLDVLETIIPNAVRSPARDAAAATGRLPKRGPHRQIVCT
jgi:hypothetical protein